MSFPSITGALPLVQAGKLRQIAVTTGKRSALVPELPTIAESGLPGYDRSGWYGMVASSKVPREIIVQLSGELTKAVTHPETKASLVKQGLDPYTNKPFVHFYATKRIGGQVLDSDAIKLLKIST